MMRQERDARIIDRFKADRPFHEILEDFDLSFEELERIHNDWAAEQKKRGATGKMKKVGPNEYRKEVPNA